MRTVKKINKIILRIRPTLPGYTTPRYFICRICNVTIRNDWIYVVAGSYLFFFIWMKPNRLDFISNVRRYDPNGVEDIPNYAPLVYPPQNNQIATFAENSILLSTRCPD